MAAFQIFWSLIYFFAGPSPFMLCHSYGAMTRAFLEYTRCPKDNRELKCVLVMIKFIFVTMSYSIQELDKRQVKLNKLTK